MEQSFSKVAAALVKAQKEFGPALKSSSNPHFKSRYADLAACVEAASRHTAWDETGRPRANTRCCINRSVN